jgi:hypothetical protein
LGRAHVGRGDVAAPIAPGTANASAWRAGLHVDLTKRGEPRTFVRAAGDFATYLSALTDRTLLGDLRVRALKDPSHQCHGQTNGTWIAVGVVSGLFVTGVVMLLASQNDVTFNGRDTMLRGVPLGGGLALTPGGLVF